MGHENPFSVLIAAIVGIPMYADIFGTIPIAEAAVCFVGIVVIGITITEYIFNNFSFLLI